METKRISAVQEWLLLTRQAALIMWYDRWNLMVSLIFPIAATLITTFVAGENMFVHHNGTKSACFVIVSAAIWGGLFNSIQIVVRERANIKRDFVSGMRLRCYTASRAITQLLLCLIQSALLSSCFLAVQWKYGNNLPESGIILHSAFWEYYISIFLLMYAADTMGLFVSCLVRKVETANVLSPYILIGQLIFSGILFEMKGASELISYAMLSRWGMEVLGSISNLNELPLAIQLTVPSVPHEAEDMFLHTTQHLYFDWGILAWFSIGFIVLGNVCLHRVAKDSR